MKQVLTVSLLVLILITISSCKKESALSYKIDNYIGDVSIMKNGEAKTPEAGTYLKQNDVIITGDNSIADILYSDTGLIRIYENSEIEITVIDKSNKQSGIELKNGKMYALVSKLKKDHQFKAKAKTIVVSVRGTSFRVRADQDSSAVDVVTGTVKVHPVVDGREVPSVTKLVAAEQTLTLDEKTAKDVAEKETTITLKQINPAQLQQIKSEIQQRPSKKLHQLQKQEKIEQETIIKKAFDKTYGSFLGINHGETIEKVYSIFGEPSKKQMPKGKNKYATLVYSYNNTPVMNVYYHIDTKKISTFMLGNFENPIGGHNLVLEYVKSRGITNTQKTFLGKNIKEIKTILGKPAEEKNSMCRYTGEKAQAVFTLIPEDRVCNIISLVWF